MQQKSIWFAATAVALRIGMTCILLMKKEVQAWTATTTSITCNTIIRMRNTRSSVGIRLETLLFDTKNKNDENSVATSPVIQGAVAAPEKAVVSTSPPGPALKPDDFSSSTTGASTPTTTPVSAPVVSNTPATESQQQPPPPSPSTQDMLRALGTSPRRILLSGLSAAGIALAGNLFGVTSRLLTYLPEDQVAATGLDTYFPRGDYKRVATAEYSLVIPKEWVADTAVELAKAQRRARALDYSMRSSSSSGGSSTLPDAGTLFCVTFTSQACLDVCISHILSLFRNFHCPRPSDSLWSTRQSPAEPKGRRQWILCKQQQ